MADHEQLLPPWWHHWLPGIGAAFGGIISGMITLLLWLTKDRMYVQKVLEDALNRLEKLEETHERWDDGNVLNDKINDLDKRHSIQLTEVITMLKDLRQRLDRENGHKFGGGNGK